MPKPLHVYIIAGEASGDQLGAEAMRSVKRTFGSHVRFSGIGGALMAEEGLHSLFPMEELSLMGIIEIVPQLRHILKRIQQSVENVEEVNPDIILSIDSPDFCFRVQKRVMERGKCKAKRVHYVAPTVWAWREGRAQKIAGFLDGLMCLFPFEPPYFEKEGLKTRFVGHPVLQNGIIEAVPDDFLEETGIAGSEKTLGIFLGSRKSEIKRMGKIICDALYLISAKHPDLHVIAPTLPHLEGAVFDVLKEYDGPLHITTEQHLKWSAFKACQTAIAVSGTVGLELAVADVPHVIGYKVNSLTYEIVRRMVKVRHAHLANIMLDDRIVPECIQPDCKPEIIAGFVNEMLDDPLIGGKQKVSFDKVRAKIKPPATDVVATFLAEVLVGD